MKNVPGMRFFSDFVVHRRDGHRLHHVPIAGREGECRLVTLNCALGVTVNVTFAVGCKVSTTVQLSVAPPSVTLVEPLDCVIGTPAVSLSVICTITLAT